MKDPSSCIGLSILDVLSTIMILDHKEEVSPFVSSAMNVHATSLQLMYIIEINDYRLKE
jgi:hypothetical protein